MEWKQGDFLAWMTVWQAKKHTVWLLFLSCGEARSTDLRAGRSAVAWGTVPFVPGIFPGGALFCCQKQSTARPVSFDNDTVYAVVVVLRASAYQFFVEKSRRWRQTRPLKFTTTKDLIHAVQGRPQCQLCSAQCALRTECRLEDNQCDAH